jgi:hypothetical protein
MRQQDHLAALGRKLGDGRCDALEPCRVSDAAIVGGHVEIDAQQHALALHVDVIEGRNVFVIGGSRAAILRDAAPCAAPQDEVSPSW